MRWCTSLTSISRCAIAASSRASCAARCSVTSVATSSSWSAPCPGVAPSGQRSAHPRRAPRPSAEAPSMRYSRVVTLARRLSAFSMSRRSAAAIPGAKICSGGWPISPSVVVPAARALTSLACTHGSVRASSSVIASGAASMTRCSDACACDMRGLGLAPPLDVEQRVGELAAARIALGRDGVADDPELAPVARRGPGTRRSRPGPRPARRASCVRRNGWSGSAVATVDIGSPTKSARVAAEHAPRRAVHPLDALRPDGDDADQHRIEARALGLQRHRALGAMARVDVDVRGDDAAARPRPVDQALADLHPHERPSRAGSGARRSSARAG